MNVSCPQDGRALVHPGTDRPALCSEESDTLAVMSGLEVTTCPDTHLCTTQEDILIENNTLSVCCPIIERKGKMLIYKCYHLCLYHDMDLYHIQMTCYCTVFSLFSVFYFYNEKTKKCIGTVPRSGRQLTEKSCDTAFYIDGDYIRENGTDRCIYANANSYNIRLSDGCTREFTFNGSSTSAGYVCLKSTPSHCIGINRYGTLATVKYKGASYIMKIDSLYHPGRCN